MNKLFQNEQDIVDEEDFFHSDDDEAGKLLQNWNLKKRSVLPQGSPATYSKK